MKLYSCLTPAQKVRSIIIGAILAILLNTSFILNAQVISGSMENTIMTNDKLVYSKLIYKFSKPKRFDVILFKFPDGAEGDLPFVKRVIGLPGETIEIKDGEVFINGSVTPLNDEFIKEKNMENYGPFKIPIHSYFVLGDNRNDSWDSKNWDTKYVFESKIIGKAMFVWHPSFRFLNLNYK